uniref:GAE domain-containing protein n=1 Tax=Sphenodon punctatus TaxID=8508 RepID=A0A8D0GWQ4_SPHPU
MSLGLNDSPEVRTSSPDFVSAPAPGYNGHHPAGPRQTPVSCASALGNGWQGSSPDKKVPPGLAFKLSAPPGAKRIPSNSPGKPPPPDAPVSDAASELRPAAPSQPDVTLANLFVPLNSITPSSLPPVTVYDQNSFKVMLHFSRDRAPGQPDVLVTVLSMLSTSAQPIQDVVFQAAVPKVMRLKLQPASGSELPAFNPLLPPALISQVLLLANPPKVPIRLRYRLTFTQGGEPRSEVGEVTGFPEAELWGRQEVKMENHLWP